MPHEGFQAKWTVALLLANAAFGAGCQRIPIRTIEATEERPAKSTVTGALRPSKAVSKPGELPPLPASPVPPRGPDAETEPDDDREATPLLDAAISRANHLDRLGTDETSKTGDDSDDTADDPKPAAAAESKPALPTVKPATPDAKEKEVAKKPAIEAMSAVELPSLSAPPAPIATSSLASAAPAETPKKEEAKPLAAELPLVLDSKDPWNEGIERLREFARHKVGEPTGEIEAWTIRARLLDHLAGADDPDSANGEAWSSVLVGLATATGQETPDLSILSIRLIEAVDALEALEPLRITEFVTCRKVLGFGAFEPVDPLTLRAGQDVLLYCELSGLRYDYEDSAYRSRITSKVELVKGEGGQVVWSQPLGSADDLCRHRRRDYYVNYRIAIPSSVPPGPYRLRITQTDLVGNQTTDSELRIAVHGEVGSTPNHPRR